MTSNNYNVRFTDDYYSLTTVVDAHNEDEAVINATQLLMHHHGIDVSHAFDIQVEHEGTWTR